MDKIILNEDKCSKCGGRVIHRVLLSYPTQDEWSCDGCGTRKTERRELPKSQIIQMD